MNRLIATVACVAILLSACGGGGGGGSPGTPGPTPQDLANAKAARLGAGYGAANHVATLSWTDAFPTTGGFQIQQQSADGSWSTVETLPGVTGSGQTLTWSGAVVTPTAFRIEAMLTGYSVTLQTVSGQDQLTITPPQTAPTLNVATALPIAVPTLLSISGGGPYTQVSYFIDSTAIGTSTTAPDYAVDFGPSGTTAGSHVFSADLYINADVYLLVQQTIPTASPDLALSLQVQPILHGYEMPSGIQLLITATSDFGIKIVTAAIDGVFIGSLTAPNNPTCYPSGCYAPYGFVVTAKSGSHIVTVTATDGNNETATVEQQVVVSNAPTLTVSAPLEGALANGTLTISGTATTDKSTGVTTVAYLNNVEIMKTTSSPSFTVNASLASVTPGAYTLVLQSVDADGLLTPTVSIDVTVTSSATLVYPLFSPSGGIERMAAAENSTLLYEALDGSMHLRTGTNDVQLQNPVGGPSIAGNNSPWLLNNGYAFFSDASSVYAWSPAGVPQQLSSTGTLVAVHVPWVLWLSGPNGGPYASYTFYNMVSKATLAVPVPAGTSGFNVSAVQTLPSPTDFFTSSAGLTLYYSAGVTSNTFPVYRWTQSSGASTVIPGTIGPNFPDLQTDGVRVAWEYSPSLGPSLYPCPCVLQVLDVASNTVQNLSQDSTQFYLADGLLAWQESSPQGGGIKVSDGTTTTVVSDRLSTYLWGVSNGHVLYEDNGKLYVWSNAGGSVLLYDAVPLNALLSSGTSSTTVFFATGSHWTSSEAIYSVPVH